MKSRIIKALLLALVLVLVFGTVSSTAYMPYTTYTYSIDGEPLQSPAAYMALEAYDAAYIGIPAGEREKTKIADLVSDEKGNVYLVDSGLNRIIVLDSALKMQRTITGYEDEYGQYQTFSNPQGIFVSNPEINAEGVESYIYICDTGNKRIVIFDRSYEYVKTIKCPTNSALLKEEDFIPNSIAVDLYGRIFVLADGCYRGVIVLSQNGDFTGYIGAQKVSSDFFEELWENFRPEDKKGSSSAELSYPFNNITIDEDGFVYVTTDGIDKVQQYGAIRSKSADFSPVKKLNSTGIEIMNRNGFFDPGGEVDVFMSEDVSTIVDVALGQEGSWTILDSKRNRLFTYDQSGNLLFAFGDSVAETGDQLGCGASFTDMTYQVIDGEYYLLVLDVGVKSGFTITAYMPTLYYDSLMTALRNQNEHNYEEAIGDWQEVLTKNNNFDLAYIGIGKALFSQGKYDEAYEMLQNAYETSYASKAKAETNKGVINQAVIPILIVIIVLVVLFFKFLGFAKRKNKAVSLKVGKKTYWEELLYVFHLVFHPFDGFWDLKHEKRGSVRAATTILAITMLAFLYQSVGKAYLFNPRGDYSMAFMSLLAVLLPVLLFAIANWCLTTLFEGEGSFKDIYIATCYSLAPLPLFVILSTVLTHVFTLSESSMVNMLVTIAFIWTAILLFFGMMVTHDYSINKNIVTILGTILAMLIIVFIVVLFSTLVMKMITFVMALVMEAANRV